MKNVMVIRKIRGCGTNRRPHAASGRRRTLQKDTAADALRFHIVDGPQTRGLTFAAQAFGDFGADGHVRLGRGRAARDGLRPDVLEARNAAEPFGNRRRTGLQCRPECVVERRDADLGRDATGVAAEEVKEAAGDSPLGDELDADTGLQDRRHRPVRLFEDRIEGLKGVAGRTEVCSDGLAPFPFEFSRNPRRGAR